MGCGRELCLKIAGATSGGTYGCRATGQVVWETSLALGRVLEHHPSFGEAFFCGRRVVELGAGCSAVPGQVAAVLGAAEVVVTDLPEELPGLQATITENWPAEARTTISAEVLDWTACSDAEIRRLASADVILSADGLFEETWELLKALCLRLVEKNPQLVLVMVRSRSLPLLTKVRNISTYLLFERLGPGEYEPQGCAPLQTSRSPRTSM